MNTGVDYAQLHKSYEAEPIGPGRYSPPKVTEIEKTPVLGAPVVELVSTSYVECHNRTIRMSNRRFTRLTNAHSKKYENHVASVALYFAHYNFVRRHSTLRCTPAMAAGRRSRRRIARRRCFRCGSSQTSERYWNAQPIGLA